MINIDYTIRQSLSSQIFEQIIRLITTGALKSGQWLPSVRQLATDLSINPNTIQKAYGDLEARGVITTVPGKGSFVAEDTVSATDQAKLMIRDTIRSAVYQAKVINLLPQDLKNDIDFYWKLHDAENNTEAPGSDMKSKTISQDKEISAND